MAYLSGGRDRRGGAVLTFPSSGSRMADKMHSDDLRTIVGYLSSVPRSVYQPLHVFHDVIH